MAYEGQVFLNAGKYLPSTWRHILGDLSTL